MMKRFFLTSIIFLSACLVVVAPTSTQALTLLPECATGIGDCSTCDILAFFATLSEFMLQFLAAAVLLSVVVGGLFWILSAGNPERVKKGQEILVGAAVGTLIALGAYFIVNGLLAALTGDTDFKNVSLFSTQWDQYCEDSSTTTTGTTTTGTSSSSETSTTTDTSSETTTGTDGATTSSCSGVTDGTKCSDSGCDNEDYCVCSSGSCVTSCEYQIASDSTKNLTYESSCQPLDADDGSSYCESVGGAILDDLGTFCPEDDYPVCCIFPL